MICTLFGAKIKLGICKVFVVNLLPCDLEEVKKQADTFMVGDRRQLTMSCGIQLHCRNFRTKYLYCLRRDGLFSVPKAISIVYTGHKKIDMFRHVEFFMPVGFESRRLVTVWRTVTTAAAFPPKSASNRGCILRVQQQAGCFLRPGGNNWIGCFAGNIYSLINDYKSVTIIMSSRDKYLLGGQ